MASLTPGDLVETLMDQQTVEEWIAFLDEEAEYQHLPDAPVYQGVAEIRRWAERELADPRRPEPLPVSLTETSDKAVVRGQVRFARGSAEKTHHVVELAAWVVTVRDGKLRRVEAYSSWDAAEEAAGIRPAEGMGSFRRLRGGFLLLRGMLSPRRTALP